MARIEATELRKTPAELNRTSASFYATGSTWNRTQLWSRPILPSSYDNQCQLTLGYRSAIDLVYRSGLVLHLSTFAVPICNDFNYQITLSPNIHPVPICKADRVKEPISFIYQVANLRGGDDQFEVVSRTKFEAVEATKTESKNI